MQVNDIIRLNVITELAGTAQSTSLYFKVIDDTLNGTLQDMIAEVASLYVASIDAWISNAAFFTCALWTNLNGNDPQTAAFFNIPGGALADALPVTNVVRVKREGIDAGVKHRGAINIGGIAETSVERGRLINAGEVENIESFLTSNVLPPVAGTVLENGFLYNTGPLQTPVYVANQKATTNPIIKSLRTRQTKLCAV